MYKGRRILFLTCAYDEEAKIGEVFRRLPPEIGDETLLIDDGSTDRTAEIARQWGAHVISLGEVKGVGYALRRGFEFALDGDFDVIVTVAANNKDDPAEIPRLLDPICDDDYDFVIGSRFLAGGGYGGDMPAYRKLATRLHPWLVGRFCGRKLTETTNGFRAMKVSLLRDERIDLSQRWLDHYELEVYLLMKIMRLGYRTAEVPCTKIYPAKRVGRTKMKPVVDWWRMLRPVLLLGLGLRR